MWDDVSGNRLVEPSFGKKRDLDVFYLQGSVPVNGGSYINHSWACQERRVATRTKLSEGVESRLIELLLEFFE